jgi:branched-chain amino acid transport system substrate-binding protein
MSLSRRGLLGSATAAAALPSVARGQRKAAIRVGVLADQNGPYADFSGPGSVIAARLAAEEFADGVLGRPIEILSGDHQNKPDISSAIARRWIDTEGVEAVLECSTSGSALALQQVMREKERVFLITVAGTSDLTGKACSPFGFHFNCDTYALAHSTAQALIGMGGDSWFFITVDYAFGHALERDASRFVREAGHQVLGAVRHPLGTTDFSSYLLKAQASAPR